MARLLELAFVIVLDDPAAYPLGSIEQFAAARERHRHAERVNDKIHLCLAFMSVTTRVRQLIKSAASNTDTRADRSLQRRRHGHKSQPSGLSKLRHNKY